MPHPGAFKGSRKEFLLSEKSSYADAIKNGYVQDFLSNLVRRYFKRYPVTLLHDQEPTAEALAAVDDSAADPKDSDSDDSLGKQQREKLIKIRTEVSRPEYS